jgi:murein DD-endopeptidase MepM/ murein hydrolase activator NlpD
LIARHPLSVQSFVIRFRATPRGFETSNHSTHEFRHSLALEEILRPNWRFQNERRAAIKRIVILTAAGFFAILGAVVLMNLSAPGVVTGPRELLSQKIEGGGRTRANAAAAAAYPTGSNSSSTAASDAAVSITSADFNALNIKNLLIPVAGVGPGQLRDSFQDARSEGRTHRALDIMAPRDTAVLATDDGKVLKLHQSGRGGIMLYQSDRSGTYVYYYGHLTRYADGICEGKAITRGEVIGFVGDTGNAGPGNYHLHFGISKMAVSGRWSGGEPINPYPLLAEKPALSSISAGK